MNREVPQEQIDRALRPGLRDTLEPVDAVEQIRRGDRRQADRFVLVELGAAAEQRVPVDTITLGRDENARVDQDSHGLFGRVGRLVRARPASTSRAKAASGPAAPRSRSTRSRPVNARSV